MPLAVVTTGPSSVPIDGVRRITNTASGEIGALLAATLHERGFEVLLMRGCGSIHSKVPDGALLSEFATNDDLAHLLGGLAETRGDSVQAVFHAAALSDYALTSVRGPDGAVASAGKIPGDLAELRLDLAPAPKLLPRLRAWFPKAWIVAWKYELEGSSADAIAAARAQISKSHADASVVNGQAYGAGFGLVEGESAPLHFMKKKELAAFLADRAHRLAQNPARQSDFCASECE